MVHVPRVSIAVGGCLSGGGYSCSAFSTVPPIWSRYGHPTRATQNGGKQTLRLAVVHPIWSTTLKQLRSASIGH